MEPLKLYLKMEVSLPTVNTTSYAGIRSRYNLGGGSYGLNLKIFNGVPYLIVFSGQDPRYEDQTYEETVFYEWQDQVRRKDGSLKPNPKPPLQFGPVGRNRSVTKALELNGGAIPTILIHREGLNRWAELYSDCVCRGVSVASDGAHYFRIERSRVPYWLPGPREEEEEE